jgi:hypothetical protein
MGEELLARCFAIKGSRMPAHRLRANRPLKRLALKSGRRVTDSPHLLGPTVAVKHEIASRVIDR